METAKSLRRFFGLGIGIAMAMTPLAAFAQVYGSGTYGSGVYGGSTSGGGSSSGGGSKVHLGPISLPITGPGAWATWGTLAVILAALLFYWAVSHRKKRVSANEKNR